MMMRRRKDERKLQYWALLLLCRKVDVTEKLNKNQYEMWWWQWVQDLQ